MANTTKQMARFTRIATLLAYALIALITLQSAWSLSATMNINGDAPYTNSYIVTLNILAPAGAQCAFANDLPNAFSTPEACGPTRAWTIGAGGGTRIVYMRVTNGTETLDANDSIILDATPPQGMVVINNGAPGTESPIVTLALTSSDNLAGVDACRLSNEDYVFTPWQGCLASMNWQLSAGEGDKQVILQVRDHAGNIGQGYQSISYGVCHDNDNDLVTDCQGDCDDNDPAVFPGALEICDLKDNNCNLLIDDGLTCGGNSSNQSNTTNCTSGWQCGDWSACVGNTQSRVCVDANACAADRTESQACTSGSTGGSSGGSSRSGGSGGSALPSITIPNITVSPTPTPEDKPSWECGFGPCVNGTSLKHCVDKTDSKNVFDTAFACDPSAFGSNGPNGTVAPARNATGPAELPGNSTATVIYAKIKAQWPIYLFLLLCVLAASLLIMSYYVFNYDALRFRERYMEVDKMLDERVKKKAAK